MNGYLVDTNVLSELRKGSRANPSMSAWLEEVKDETLFLSVLTIGELRFGVENLRIRDPKQSAALDKWLDNLQERFSGCILDLTKPIAERWGRLRVPQPIAVIDGLIAATALEHSLTLATRNVQHVLRTGVKFVNPFLP
jgi:predicted nucleic acid-binding protein